MKPLLVLLLILVWWVPLVGTEATPSLVETHWTFGLKLPDGLAGKRSANGLAKADILVWTPDGAKRIRAMLLIAPLLDSKIFGEHDALRKVAAKHEMAIIYLRNFNTGIERTQTPDPDRIQKLLDIIARETGIAEFRYAPWIAVGRSAGEGSPPRGEFPFRMGWLYPGRTIAGVSYHGEASAWPVADWARLNGETILYLHLNGDNEDSGTWFTDVRPTLLNYRAKTAWLAHQVVAHNVGGGEYPDCHGGPGWGKEFSGEVTCIRTWNYLSLFIDKALTLRVPANQYPSEGPLTLKQVDEGSGYLIDPFAVEELFGVPRLPLREGANGYVPGGEDMSTIRGFASLAPLKGFTVPSGVPVVKYQSGKSPREWLITECPNFGMKADPMCELGNLRNLMPKPGDKAIIDGQPFTFLPILPKYVAANGGIQFKGTGLRPGHGQATFLAYTVLDFSTSTFVRVNARYSVTARVQVVINGIPVRHQQVLELQPGRYPMLVVLRMYYHWRCLDPSLSEATEAEVAQARQIQADSDARAAAQTKLDAANATKRILVRKAADVPETECRKMFWVADIEQAEAWFELHNVRGRRFPDVASVAGTTESPRPEAAGAFPVTDNSGGFRGRARNGIFVSTPHLLRKWPPEGPKLVRQCYPVLHGDGRRTAEMVSRHQDLWRCFRQCCRISSSVRRFGNCDNEESHR